MDTSTIFNIIGYLLLIFHKFHIMFSVIPTSFYFLRQKKKSIRTSFNQYNFNILQVTPNGQSFAEIVEYPRRTYLRHFARNHAG